MSLSIKINGCLYEFDTLRKIVDEGALFPSSATEWQQNVASFLKEWINGEEYVTGKTSGSTGSPKTILLSKKAMIASALRTNCFFQLKKNDDVLLCLSAQYIAGKMMIVRAIAGGFNLKIVPPSSSPEWKGSVDFAAMVPSQVQSLLATEEGKKRLCSVKKIIIGGSPVSGLLEKNLYKIPTDCYLTYGMTETLSHVALCRIEKNETKEKVYRALPDVVFKTDDRNCLVIHAPYIQKESFVTNDVVKLLSETSFVWLGRWDNVINSGGVKFFPEEIERKISDLIDARFYITALSHELFGQQLVLKIESPPWNEEKKTLFMQNIASRLTKYEIPKQIIFTDKLEKTTTGKIKRK